jgi:hypothetical protein
MKQTLIKLSEHQDRVVQVVKGKYGLKNKNEAIQFIVNSYEENLIEPELRPEFIEKMEAIDKKGNFSSFKSLEDLDKELENA